MQTKEALQANSSLVSIGILVAGAAIALGLVVPGSVFANDSAVEGIGGSWHPLKAEHPSVRMVRESVTIHVFKNHYSTLARFEFQNQGSAAVVSMGFPEGGWGDIARPPGQKSGFLHFSTSVDGQPIQARRVIANRGEEDYQAYWVKQVHFNRGQRRLIQVRYESQPGEMADPIYHHFVVYHFTGGNWRGDVDESLLTVVLHTPRHPHVKAEMNEKPLQPVRSSQGTYVYLWRHWQAEGTFVFHFGDAGAHTQ